TTVFTPDARLSNGRARGDGPLRRQFGIAADASVVGFVGRLSPEKAPEVFLRAALGVFRAQPDAHFVIVGDGPLRESCGQFVAQFGMQGRVHFCGMQHDMPSVYSELDIVVSTSHAEAMPLGLMEAMASGIPVVATKVGGVPDLIAQGVSGWLVGDNDFEGFAWHLNNLLSDVSVRCDMGRAGRQRVVEQFSLAESVAKTGALFESLSRPRTELRSVAQLTPSRNPRFVAPAKPPATINIAHPT
ncbi:MAG: glycosyltransferase, partial [Rhizobacter sp.]|nr:glycosyltransferase [Rhizobacter sp.]